ncbi:MULTISPECIES: hypothetical protein [Bradyrhizobium]|uniref:Uncharacterized protein n=1 Tax=Bradyrhizobium septentrionale TaxID=1404411 RepID=A0A973VXV2_9BRAD|nr:MULTISPECIES: hypothetical protein [Bradyrhizobium]UGY25625.1 hypothetical protein HU675_0001705 [Bradyrhizobium septentrionale]
MDGWIVTVSVLKEDGHDDEDFRHITYVVALADPADAVRMTIAECGAKAAMLTCPIDEKQLPRPGLKPGELLVVQDDEINPIISRPRRISVARLISSVVSGS